MNPSSIIQIEHALGQWNIICNQVNHADQVIKQIKLDNEWLGPAARAAVAKMLKIGNVSENLQQTADATREQIEQARIEVQQLLATHLAAL